MILQKKCLYCGSTFTRKLDRSLKQWEKRKYCSQKCGARDSTKKGKRFLFKKGHKPSLETRKRISKKLKGNKNGRGNRGNILTEERKKEISKDLRRQYQDGMRVAPFKGRLGYWAGKKRPKLGYRMKGNGNPNWKDGITPEEKAERARFRKITQKKVFERDNYTCQICGQYGGKLQVDHIKSWAEYPEFRFEMSNCRTLCMGCHYKITFGRFMPEEVKTWGHNFFKARKER